MLGIYATQGQKWFEWQTDVWQDTRVKVNFPSDVMYKPEYQANVFYAENRDFVAVIIIFHLTWVMKIWIS